MCTSTDIAETLKDRYPGDKVWIYEQAKIHCGAIKFGLTKLASVATAVRPQIGKNQELLGVRRAKKSISHIQRVIPASCFQWLKRSILKVEPNAVKGAGYKRYLPVFAMISWVTFGGTSA